ncbi:glycoside hydrolase family 16 protein [Hymenopellis radicata]|nr:glycoside hydrolase family 16 protein [Hymenopellis radicata]
MAFGPVLVTQRSEQAHLTYCTLSSNKGLSGSGSDSGDGNGHSGLGPSASSTRTATGTSAAPTGSTSASPWSLVETHTGNDFFDGWSFWTTSDPTHGIVDYVDESTGRSNGLLEVNSDGNAIMRVETTDIVSANRKSIRITTESSYNTGTLAIMDSVHMPTGCGTWPAWWSNGPNWPIGGEIDIIEGVNNYTNNQATVHTDTGCTISTDDETVLGITGTVIGGTNCAAYETGNQGCGIQSNSDVSFGRAFNNNGGGVYALKWDDTGISVYFWATGSVPADVTAETPVPATWGEPMANWPSSGCNPSKYFYDNTFIFDTTLCGDWAGSAWSSTDKPGQEESCATRTGFSDCESFVRASGSSFHEAYWEVKSVKFYTLK